MIESFYLTVLSVGVGLLLLTYVLFPLLMLGIERRLSAESRVIAGGTQDSATRKLSVGVILAAHNEEQVIEERLKNLLAQDYPRDLLKVYVGSDGSTDRTCDLVRALNYEQVVLHDFRENRGKAAVLNDLVANASEEILVFTDANTFFEDDAIACLVRRFNDPAIAGVSGELRIEDVGSETSESSLWSIESRIKRAESSLGTLLGANGAIYAIRRECYSPLPNDVIIDDFVNVMNVATAGGKVVFEPRAIAREESAASLKGEYRRRVRIGVGNYRTFFRYPQYLWRSGFARGLVYFVHKVLRWFSPQIAVIVLIASVLGAGDPRILALLIAQIIGYGCALAVIAVTHLTEARGIGGRLAYFVALNLALLHGFVLFIAGKMTEGAWSRTAR
jgi:cellulose synthase/poly-beta-1,6-N-acetylglucosamine synthase-like glycosyltransferase